MQVVFAIMKSADFCLPAGLFNRSPLDDHMLPGAAAAFSHLEFRSTPGRLPAGGSSGQVGRRALAGGEPPPARPGTSSSLAGTPGSFGHLPAVAPGRGRFPRRCGVGAPQASTPPGGSASGWPGGLGRFRSGPAGRLCFSGAFLRFR
mgnify:FL=1